jgi:hypothetical protein
MVKNRQKSRGGICNGDESTEVEDVNRLVWRAQNRKENRGWKSERAAKIQIGNELGERAIQVSDISIRNRWGDYPVYSNLGRFESARVSIELRFLANSLLSSSA